MNNDFDRLLAELEAGRLRIEFWIRIAIGLLAIAIAAEVVSWLRG